MVAAPAYVPRRGDVVWLTFNPQAGHEQAGRRPAVVLSPSAYNAKVGLALLCPITSQVKGYPFEVILPPGLAVQSAMRIAAFFGHPKGKPTRAYPTGCCRIPTEHSSFFKSADGIGSGPDQARMSLSELAAAAISGWQSSKQFWCRSRRSRG